MKQLEIEALGHKYLCHNMKTTSIPTEEISVKKFDRNEWNRARRAAQGEEEKAHKKAYNKRYNEAHKEERKAKYKVYYEAHKEEAKARTRAYYTSNTEKQKAYSKAYSKTHAKEIKANSKAYYEAHKETIMAYNNAYATNRRRVDELYRVKGKLRSAVLKSFTRIKKNKPTNTQALMGCTFEEAKSHIESLWQEGMSWDNHSVHGWHIDHIRPISDFTEDELHLINHISNLQPLWAGDNISKSDRY